MCEKGEGVRRRDEIVRQNKYYTLEIRHKPARATCFLGIPASPLSNP